MTYYAIRHLKSDLLMPEVRTRGGYSHWNPNNPNMPNIFFNHPRLFETRERANRSITRWIVCQNGRRGARQSYSGEWDDLIDIKLDGRKKEDVEVIEVELIRKDI